MSGPATRPSSAPLLDGRLNDFWIAGAAGVLAFSVYLTTMFPGLFGLGDAAKFAFVGRVLGTPHSPGYPLYVLVSHLFSYVPWGSLAHRMNGFSALLASVAVCLVYFGVRHLGGGRVAAVSTALAMAFGRSFWAKAIYAKTYPLNAVLVAAGLLMLVHWGRTRRRAHFYAAVAIFALSAANHLIVVALVPALVLYVLLVEPHIVKRPRTLAAVALIVCAGLSIYGFILVRTWQQAPYLEARASNLRELVDVMTARRYANEIGAFSADAVRTVRIPAVAGLVTREFSAAGLVLLGIGVIVLGLKRPRETLLYGLGAVGVLALTVNMSSDEDEGFLLAAFVALWPIAGLGLDWLISRIARASGAAITAILATLVAAVIPVAQVAANYRANDHHRRTFETRYFDSLFATLPNNSTIVGDRYDVNMMVLYKLLGEGAGRERNITFTPLNHAAIARAWDEGRPIFVFDYAREALGLYGFRFAPVELLDGTLAQFVQALPDGSTIVIAGTSGLRPGPARQANPWQTVGAGNPEVFGNPRTPYALIGVMGAAGPGLEATQPGRTQVSVARGESIGRTGFSAPVSIQAVADTGQAVVTIDGIEKGRSRGGFVVATISPSGEPDVRVLAPEDNQRVPFDMRLLPLFRATAVAHCADVGNTGWQGATSLAATGHVAVRIDNYRPHLTQTIFYLAGADAFSPVTSKVSGSGEPRTSTTTFVPSTREGQEALRQALAADKLDAFRQLSAAPVVSRVEINVDDGGDFVVLRVDLGGSSTPAFVRSMVDMNVPERAIVCGIPDQTR